MMSEHSKTKTSFYRRLYVAWLISQGVNSVPKIIEATGMPRRTAQDTLAAIHELDIELENNGGIYRVEGWGAVNQHWVETNLLKIKTVLEYP
ncbi:winged helix-turn-helix domain-containing protein [Cellvibrio sp. NN19]|uniref:winged helix-turn-helix domain-containing protein n=1 Tax=Cellvibrio chitinivorans TaxID=3102792 RepID=UPI002B409AB2|nr:winged helix-turn-helix domain-containing protein [Cellvibrio sp. NN19]